MSDAEFKQMIAQNDSSLHEEAREHAETFAAYLKDEAVRGRLANVEYIKNPVTLSGTLKYPPHGLPLLPGRAAILMGELGKVVPEDRLSLSCYKRNSGEEVCNIAFQVRK